MNLPATDEGKDSLLATIAVRVARIDHEVEAIVEGFKSQTDAFDRLRAVQEIMNSDVRSLCDEVKELRSLVFELLQRFNAQHERDRGREQDAG